MHLHSVIIAFKPAPIKTFDAFLRFPADGPIGNPGLFADRRKSQGRAKIVPAWLDAAHMVLAQAIRANFELALRAEFPLRDGSLTRKPEFVVALVRTAEAFQPFVEFLTKGRTH